MVKRRKINNNNDKILKKYNKNAKFIDLFLKSEIIFELILNNI